MPTAVLIFIVIAVPLLWLIGTYNGLVRLRNHCRESWSGIDNELKRRYDLIPRLVEVVKGYAKHERAVFERVAQARAAALASTGSPASQARDENVMIGAMKGLFAVIERYPELKASGNFLALQTELVNTEDRIAAARRFYNANVRDFNTRMEVFPANLLAGLLGFKKEEFFEIEDHTIRAAPSAVVGVGDV